MEVCKCEQQFNSIEELSRANSTHTDKKKLLSQASSSGSSVETYKAMMEHIENSLPSFVMIENSDALCDESEADDSNVNVLLARLGNAYKLKTWGDFALLTGSRKAALATREFRLLST